MDINDLAHDRLGAWIGVGLAIIAAVVISLVILLMTRLNWYEREMASQIEAARALTYQAADMITTQDPRRTYMSACSKLIASDVAMKVTTDALQIAAGYGYMTDFPFERMMRDAKITQIYEGTNQVQKLVISRELAK